MKEKYSVTPTSYKTRVKLMDSTKATGEGLIGLTSASAGLIIAVIKAGEATTTAYTQAASNIETIATLGTYAAPTAGKIRFKELDAVNHKGVYEIQVANARFTSTDKVTISFSGATDLAEQDIEIQIESITVTTVLDKTGYTATASNMRGTDNAALAATALNKAVWTAAKAAFLDAAITGRATPAQVNAQVLDVMNVDAFADLAAGIPPSTPTMRQMMQYVFNEFIHKFIQEDPTASGNKYRTVYNQGGAAIYKKKVADDGADYTETNAEAV